MVIIEFFDEECSYGMIETKELPEKIREILDEYRNQNEDSYNIDDFLEILKEKKIGFEIIPTESDFSIRF